MERHGDTHLGVDWPNVKDAQTRYQVMLDLIPPEKRGASASMLDFGCGASHLYEYMLARENKSIRYAGLDISPKFIDLSAAKFPENEYFCVDLLMSPTAIPTFDYIVMNGVFTEKRELSFDAMLSYFRTLVAAAFDHASIGLAFNVMSKHVDWERDDLFHLPFDYLAEFLRKNVSGNYVFRSDYGLFEYTAYVYK